MSTASGGMVELRIHTSGKSQVLDITSQVVEAVASLGIADGLCHVYVAHTTAAITINENADHNIGVDLLAALERLVPAGVWLHDKIDDNGAAHIKASIIGPGETIPVRQRQLLLGTWQAVMLVEFDGPRTRQVIVSMY